MNTTSNVKFIQGTEVINSYLADVRKYDVITAEEEKKLFELIKNGDTDARDKIILVNQRYVYSQAKKYALGEDDIMDYVQIGNIGMIEAIDRFDVEQGNRFLTFAKFYIQRAMNNYMNDKHDLVAKSNNAKYGKRIEKIKNEFFKTEFRYPTYEEIMDLYKEKYDEEIKDIRDVYDMTIDSMSLDINDDYTVEDTNDFAIRTASYNEYDEECDKVEEGTNAELVNSILDFLPTKHSDIIRKFYGIGGDKYSIDELAEEYCMYPEQMQKIIDKSIQYVKENAEKVALKKAL